MTIASLVYYIEKNIAFYDANIKACEKMVKDIVGSGTRNKKNLKRLADLRVTIESLNKSREESKCKLNAFLNGEKISK